MAERVLQMGQIARMQSAGCDLRRQGNQAGEHWAQSRPLSQGQATMVPEGQAKAAGPHSAERQLRRTQICPVWGRKRSFHRKVLQQNRLQASKAIFPGGRSRKRREIQKI